MAYNESSTIRQINQPTIVLDELSYPSLSDGVGEEQNSKYAKYFGAYYPMIRIRGYNFSRDDIQEFRISSSGFLPTIFFQAKIKNVPFTQQSAPLDGDVVSVMIRSKTDVLKPLRNDYTITSSNIRKVNDAENGYYVVTISGKLRIPKLRFVKCFSDSGTSFKVLERLTSKLDIGFASNITETNDDMVWLAPNISYEEFITNTINHSWKDDNSFFDCYIDTYYMLNFIEVNSQLDDSPSVVDGAIDILTIRDFFSAESEGKSTKTTKLILSNHPEVYPSSNFISGYELPNASTEISHYVGYKQYLHFYEKTTKEHQVLIIDPLMADGAAESKIILRGRKGEDFYKEENVHVWSGIQYSNDNVHVNYHYAQRHRTRNLAELNKQTLRITLMAPNFNIIRYQKLPVFLFLYKDISELQAVQTKEEKDNSLEIGYDRFLSGWYCVREIEYQYNGRTGAFTQTLVLSRREWPTPVTIAQPL